MLPRILSIVVGWVQAHHVYILEIEERDVTLDSHRNVGEGHLLSGCRERVRPFLHEVSVFGSAAANVGGSASLVAGCCGLQVFADTATIWEVRMI